MKQFEQLKRMYLIGAFGLTSTCIAAQISVGDLISFDEAFVSVKATGGEITLDADILFTSGYELTATAPVVINANGKSLVSVGTDNSDTSATLTIGANILIHGGGSADLVKNSKKGKILLDGGTLDKSGTAGAAISLTAGNGQVISGSVKSSTSRVVNLGNSYNLVVDGGTFIGAAASSRGIYASGANSKVNVNGGTFDMQEAGAVAVLMDDNSPNCRCEVNGGSFSGAGTALRVQKGAVIVVRGGEITADTPKSYSETGARKIYDFRACIITASPGAGEYVADQNVTLTLDMGNDASEAEDALMRYTTDGSEPTKDSEVYSDAILIRIPSTLKVVPEKDGNLGNIVSLLYESPSIVGLENGLKSGCVIYPSVVVDKVMISGEADVMRVELFNINGICVFSSEVTTPEIDLSSIATGYYIIKVFTGKGCIAKSLLKQ